MKKFTKILILSIFTILLFSGFTSSVLADSSTVEFESTPLFGEANFAPGNSISKYIKLNNNTDNLHMGIVRALDVVNTGGLGDVTNLQIKQGSTILYNDNFSNFFNKSEVNLLQVASGDSKIFDFIITFDLDSGNEYENSIMSFSLEAGFEDDITTDTIVIGGGGGGSVILSGPKNLIITKENALVLPLSEELNTITITWDTNLPATSQVIYGLTSDGPYNINLTDPNLGYPSSTLEQDLDKVLSHLVVISNLPAGEYNYRVVSRASPPTISYEHSFTILSEKDVVDLVNPILSINTQPDVLNNNFSNLRDSADLVDNDLIKKEINKANNLLAASAGNILGISNLWLYVLILLLIFIILFFFYKRKKNK